MELEQQVTSLEPSEKLRELGVRQESLFYWTHCPVKEQNGEWTHVLTYGRNNELPETYAAFTVAELGEMIDGWRLPKRTMNGKAWIAGDDELPTYVIIGCKTEADARAKMLIYLLENKLITL